MKAIKISSAFLDDSYKNLTSYFESVRKTTVLSFEEEQELFKRYKEGDKEARNKLIMATTRFVITAAKKYQKQGLPLEDLIQEGNIGVCNALDRFDPSKKTRFITYCVWWIRQSIIMALIDNARVVRIPSPQMKIILKVQKEYNNYIVAYGTPPTPEYISDKIKVPLHLVILSLGVPTSSPYIDEIIKGENSENLMDIFDNGDPWADEDTYYNNKQFIIKEILNKLPDKQRVIIEMYFGFNGKCYLLKDISRKLGISMVRVKKIKDTTLVFLKHEFYDILKELYDN